MKIAITKNRSKESEVIEGTNVPRHDYWTDRRRHSFSSTRVRFL